jgi:hypothetical protein
VKNPASCTDVGRVGEMLSLTSVTEGEFCSRQIMIVAPPLLTMRPILSQPVK